MGFRVWYVLGVWACRVSGYRLRGSEGFGDGGIQALRIQGLKPGCLGNEGLRV